MVSRLADANLREHASPRIRSGPHRKCTQARTSAPVGYGDALWHPARHGPPAQDPRGNVLFMVRVECEVCGNSLLFNSEKFFSGDTPTLLPD